LQRDQVIELVAAIWSGGKPESSSRGDLLDRTFERSSGDVVAFVCDDEPVAFGKRQNEALQVRSNHR
jgi:hypothetical protein